MNKLHAAIILLFSLTTIAVPSTYAVGEVADTVEVTFDGDTRTIAILQENVKPLVDLGMIDQDGHAQDGIGYEFFSFVYFSDLYVHASLRQLQRILYEADSIINDSLQSMSALVDETYALSTDAQATIQGWWTIIFEGMQEYNFGGIDSEDA